MNIKFTKWSVHILKAGGLKKTMQVLSLVVSDYANLVRLFSY